MIDGRWCGRRSTQGRNFRQIHRWRNIRFKRVSRLGAIATVAAALPQVIATPPQRYRCCRDGWLIYDILVPAT